MNNINPVLNKFLGQLMGNPVQFLLRNRLNIPQNIANDPDAIINYLLRTGQVSQQQVNTAYQQAYPYK